MSGTSVGTDGGDGPQADVVAVERDVEGAEARLDRLERRDRRRDPVRERDPSRVEADEDDVVRAVVALDDLVRDTGQRAAEVGGVEDVGPQDRGGARFGNGGTTIDGTGINGTGLVAGVSFAGRLGRHHLLLRRDLTGSPSRSERG